MKGLTITLNGLALKECTVTGDERGDIRHTVAMSASREALTEHCKTKYGKDISTLNSLNCPVPFTMDTYYIIEESNIELV